MNDNDIIKALEELLLKSLNIKYGARKSVLITDDLLKDALDLINRLKAQNKEFDEKIVIQMGAIDWQAKEINRQKAEIERLQHRINELQHEISSCKSEAIKEFDKRFKEKAGSIVTSCKGYEIYETKQYQISAVEFDNLVKEMTEGKE